MTANPADGDPEMMAVADGLMDDHVPQQWMVWYSAMRDLRDAIASALTAAATSDGGEALLRRNWEAAARLAETAGHELAAARARIADLEQRLATAERQLEAEVAHRAADAERIRGLTEDRDKWRSRAAERCAEAEKWFRLMGAERERADAALATTKKEGG